MIAANFISLIADNDIAKIRLVALASGKVFHLQTNPGVGSRYTMELSQTFQSDHLIYFNHAETTIGGMAVGTRIAVEVEAVELLEFFTV